jgi:hypothetical protein
MRCWWAARLRAIISAANDSLARIWPLQLAVHHLLPARIDLGVADRVEVGRLGVLETICRGLQAGGLEGPAEDLVLLADHLDDGDERQRALAVRKVSPQGPGLAATSRLNHAVGEAGPEALDLGDRVRTYELVSLGRRVRLDMLLEDLLK